MADAGWRQQEQGPSQSWFLRWPGAACNNRLDPQGAGQRNPRRTACKVAQSGPPASHTSRRRAVCLAPRPPAVQIATLSRGQRLLPAQQLPVTRRCQASLVSNAGNEIHALAGEERHHTSRLAPPANNQMHTIPSPSPAQRIRIPRASHSWCAVLSLRSIEERRGAQPTPACASSISLPGADMPIVSPIVFMQSLLRIPPGRQLQRSRRENFPERWKGPPPPARHHNGAFPGREQHFIRGKSDFTLKERGLVA